MPLPNFSKLRIFLLYWALILSLGGYLAYDYCTDYYEELEPVLENSVAEGITTTHNYTQTTLGTLQAYSDAYNIKGNSYLAEKALAAMKLVENCQLTVRRTKSQKTAVDKAILSKLAIALAKLGDSLLVFADGNTSIKADLDVLIYQPAADLQTAEMISFFRNVRASQVDLYLDDLIWKQEVALNILIRYLNENLHNWVYVRFDKQVPIVAYEQCASVGRPFTGQIYLQGYSTHSDNLKCSIDGHDYPFQNGLVKFDTVFQNPGKYQQRVDIRVRNPLTDETITYFGIFGFNISKQ